MGIKYGFFDSYDHDRVYSASDFSQLYDGIFTDGVINNYLDSLEVVMNDDRHGVTVKTGKAWFNKHWFSVVTPELLTPEPPAGYRLDSVILKINEPERRADIYLKQGPESSTAVYVPPGCQHSGGINEYRLANVFIHGATIVQVSDTRGGTDCPFADFQYQPPTTAVTSWNGETGDVIYHPDFYPPGYDYGEGELGGVGLKVTVTMEDIAGDAYAVTETGLGDFQKILVGINHNPIHITPGEAIGNGQTNPFGYVIGDLVHRRTNPAGQRYVMSPYCWFTLERLPNSEYYPDSKIWLYTWYGDVFYTEDWTSLPPAGETHFVRTSSVMIQEPDEDWPEGWAPDSDCVVSERSQSGSAVKAIVGPELINIADGILYPNFCLYAPLVGNNGELIWNANKESDYGEVSDLSFDAYIYKLR